MTDTEDTVSDCFSDEESEIDCGTDENIQSFIDILNKLAEHEKKFNQTIDDEHDWKVEQEKRIQELRNLLFSLFQKLKEIPHLKHQSKKTKKYALEFQKKLGHTNKKINRYHQEANDKGNEIISLGNQVKSDSRELSQMMDDNKLESWSQKLEGLKDKRLDVITDGVVEVIHEVRRCVRVWGLVKHQGGLTEESTKEYVEATDDLDDTQNVFVPLLNDHKNHIANHIKRLDDTLLLYLKSLPTSSLPVSLSEEPLPPLSQLGIIDVPTNLPLFEMNSRTRRIFLAVLVCFFLAATGLYITFLILSHSVLWAFVTLLLLLAAQIGSLLALAVVLLRSQTGKTFGKLLKILLGVFILAGIITAVIMGTLDHTILGAIQITFTILPLGLSVFRSCWKESLF